MAKKSSYGYGEGKVYEGPWRSSDTKTDKEQKKASKKAQKATERRKNKVNVEKYFWKKIDGQLIDVDEMSVDHLRNVLKMLIRQKEMKPTVGTPIDDGDGFLSMIYDHDGFLGDPDTMAAYYAE